MNKWMMTRGTPIDGKPHSLAECTSTSAHQARHQAHGQLEQKIAEIDAGGILPQIQVWLECVLFGNHDTFLHQVCYYG